MLYLLQQWLSTYRGNKTRLWRQGMGTQSSVRSVSQHACHASSNCHLWGRAQHWPQNYLQKTRRTIPAAPRSIRQVSWGNRFNFNKQKLSYAMRLLVTTVQIFAGVPHIHSMLKSVTHPQPSLRQVLLGWQSNVVSMDDEHVKLGRGHFKE